MNTREDNRSFHYFNLCRVGLEVKRPVLAMFANASPFFASMKDGALLELHRKLRCIDTRNKMHYQLLFVTINMIDLSQLINHIGMLGDRRIIFKMDSSKAINMLS